MNSTNRIIKISSSPSAPSLRKTKIREQKANKDFEPKNEMDTRLRKQMKIILMVVSADQLKEMMAEAIPEEIAHKCELCDGDSAEDEAKAMDDDSPIIGDTMATVTQTDEEASESLNRLYEYIYEGLVSQLIEPTEADLEAAADTAEAEAIRLNDSLLDSNTSGLRSMSYATDDDPLESMDISENDPLSSKLPDSRDSEDEPMPPPPADPPPLRRSTRNSNRGENPGPEE